MVREAWWATVHEVAKEADMTWQRNHHQQRVWASLVAQMVKNLPIMQETWVRSLGREDLEEYMAIPSVFLTGESHGQPSELQPTGSQRVGHD